MLCGGPFPAKACICAGIETARYVLTGLRLVEEYDAAARNAGDLRPIYQAPPASS